MLVLSLVGLWRGLPCGAVGEVADDEVTRLGIELGCCEPFGEPAAPEELPQEPTPLAPEIIEPEPAPEPALELAPEPESEPAPARRRGRKEAR